METGEVLTPGVNAVQNVGEEDTLARVLATTLLLQALAYHAMGAQLNLEAAISNLAQVSAIFF